MAIRSGQTRASVTLGKTWLAAKLRHGLSWKSRRLAFTRNRCVLPTLSPRNDNLLCDRSAEYVQTNLRPPRDTHDGDGWKKREEAAARRVGRRGRTRGQSPLSRTSTSGIALYDMQPFAYIQGHYKYTDSLYPCLSIVRPHQEQRRSQTVRWPRLSRYCVRRLRSHHLRVWFSLFPGLSGRFGLGQAFFTEIKTASRAPRITFESRDYGGRSGQLFRTLLLITVAWPCAFDEPLLLRSGLLLWDVERNSYLQAVVGNVVTDLSRLKDTAKCCSNETSGLRDVR